MRTIIRSGRRLIPPLNFLLSTLCAAAGCATVHPPATMTDPVPLYLAEYGQIFHSIILMPRDGEFVGYTYGDWNYAALGHKFPTDALGALAVSGAADYKREILPVDPVTGEPMFNDHPARVIRFYANRQAVQNRLKQLDDRYQYDLELHRGDGLIITSYGVVFVKDTEHYSLFHNCNHLTAQTLESLGYHVDGLVLGDEFDWPAVQKTSGLSNTGDPKTNP
jgi:hypothetical protein